jgi:hypothetical protein
MSFEDGGPGWLEYIRPQIGQLPSMGTSAIKSSLLVSPHKADCGGVCGGGGGIDSGCVGTPVKM